MAIGIILVGCCPGGVSSNIMSFLCKADVAYSVGKLFKFNTAQKRTLSIEVGMQNAGLGTNLAMTFFVAEAQQRRSKIDRLYLYLRWESNPNLKFRKLPFYPLNYRGRMWNIRHSGREDTKNDTKGSVPCVIYYYFCNNYQYYFEYEKD